MAQLSSTKIDRELLTEAGRRVDEYARRILALYTEMDGSLRELTDDMAGTLMLGASMTIAEYDLPRLLVRLKQRYPEVNVKLLMANTDGVVQMVVENRIDLGLVEGPIHRRGLAVRRYDVDKLVAALPPEPLPRAAAEHRVRSVARRPPDPARGGFGNPRSVPRSRPRGRLRA